jgi:hypothetical protein
VWNESTKTWQMLIAKVNPVGEKGRVEGQGAGRAAKSTLLVSRQSRYRAGQSRLEVPQQFDRAGELRIVND